MSRRRRYSSSTRLTTDFIMLVFNFGLAAIAAVLMLVKELVSWMVSFVRDNKRGNDNKAKSDINQPAAKENVNLTINENISVVVNQSVNFNINSAANESSRTPDIILNDNQYTALYSIPCLEQLKDKDPILPEAIKVVLEAGMASTSMLQKKLKTGYARAAGLIDEMEKMGIVGPYRGSQPREVLVAKKAGDVNIGKMQIMP